MIKSTRNPKVQRVRALRDKPRQRQTESAFIIEGVRLSEEALASEWLPELVFYSKGLSERGQAIIEQWRKGGVSVEEVSPHVLAAMSETETSQGILAVMSMRRYPLPSALDFALVIDGLRDPGNLGAILRTATAAGVQAVILTPGTVDAFSPKVLRSAMGAHFRLPIHTLNWNQLKAILNATPQAVNVYLADASGDKPYWEIDLRKPLILVVGGEADGASEQAHSLATGTVYIPMPGQSESLNAASAAAVLIFDAIRQRGTL